MPSTDRKLQLKAKTLVAQTASQPFVYAKGLKSTTYTELLKNILLEVHMSSKHLCIHLQKIFWYDTRVFVNCNWVYTQWQQYSTHLHTNCTQNNTMKQLWLYSIYLNLNFSTLIIVGRDSSVGIATCYGLDCLVIESRWGQFYCTHPEQPTRPPVKWVTGLFPRNKAAGL
jgi:hypothetical protein